MEKQQAQDVKDVDLSAFDTATDREHEFQAYNPKGEPLDLFVTVVGVDSDTYQEAMRAIEKRAQERARRSGRNRGPSPEETQAAALELIAKSTRKWRGNVKIDGGPLPAFSYEAAMRLYKRWPWLREQADFKIHDRENFLPSAASG